MGHWVLKTEPDSYGWDDLVHDGATEWDGVRNHAAANHLKAMALGDEVLIYHSGPEKAAVGIARVTRAAKADGEGGWVSVAIAPIRPLPSAVTLTRMKAEAALKDLAMLRQSRLSVSPIDPAAWGCILQMAGA